MVVNIKNTNTGFIERTDTVKQYFSEVNKFDTLSTEEEKELFSIINDCDNLLATHFDAETNTYFGLTYDEIFEAQNKRDAAAKKVAECNQKFVIAVARHYAPNDKFLDCVSEGTIGLMNAINAFKLDNGVKFITFAVHYIRREITQYLRDDEPSIKKSNISKTYHTTAQARNEFIQKEEREPLPEELMDIINEKYGVDIKDVGDVTDMRIISIDETVSDDDDDACVGDMEMFNSVSAQKNGYEETEKNEYNVSLLSSLFTILTPREKEVISMSFGIGYDREYEAKEIGVKLGLTSERIRQMKTNIIERLQNEFIKRSNMI